MTDRTTAEEIEAIRAEYAEEEAEAAEAEATQQGQAILSIRVSTALAEALKDRATAEHIPTSALVRRLLAQAMGDRSAPVLTVGQVEEIARRIARETVQASR